MLASDVAALGGQATNYMVVPEYHVVELHTDDIRVYNMKNELCEAEFLDIDWDTTKEQAKATIHSIWREIMEQPEAIKATLAPRYVDGRISLEADGVPDDVLKNCERVCVVACGTAMHAGLVAQSLYVQSSYAWRWNTHLSLCIWILSLMTRHWFWQFPSPVKPLTHWKR